MRFVVVTPPIFLPTAPAAAPAVLVGVLRAAGHDAICFDVSRFCFERLLDPSAIRRSFETQAEGFFPGLGLDDLPRDVPELVTLLRAESTFHDFSRYEAAISVAELGMLAHANTHGATRWSSVEFHGDHDRTDPDALLHAVYSGTELLDESLDEAAEVLHSFMPDVVAISVSYAQQLYGALRFARAIRDLDIPARICLGGATITRLREDVRRVPLLFDLADHVMLRDGEVPLLRLATALQNGENPLETVPGLLAKVGDRILASRTSHRTAFPLARMPTPVFADLTPGPYLAPCPLLPVSTTRNCYFNKCTFCAISRSFVPGFQEMKPEQMARQIRELRAEHPGARFTEVSEALVPRTALAFADLLAIEEEVPAWEAYLRFEGPFADKDAASRLHEGGLRVAYFGLESASTRQVREMRKGMDVDQAERTIRLFADAGIWVHLFLISGHPRETERDHEQTVRFVERNAPYIHSIHPAEFKIERDSDMSTLMNTYGFEIAEDPEPTFRLDIALAERGEIPDPEMAQRRVSEIHQIAEEQRNSVLPRSPRIWGAHRILFTDYLGGPRLPEEAVDGVDRLAESWEGR